MGDNSISPQNFYDLVANDYPFSVFVHNFSFVPYKAFKSDNSQLDLNVSQHEPVSPMSSKKADSWPDSTQHDCNVSISVMPDFSK